MSIPQIPTVNIYLNGYPITVPLGLTILQANNLTKNITNAGDIPTLCYSPFLHQVESGKKKINNYTTIAHEGVCRICLVSQENKTYFVEKNMKIPQPEENPKNTKFVPACCTNVTEGASYWVNTEAVSANVKAMLNMILSTHPLECPTCSSNKNCELQDLFERYNITAKNLPSAIRKKMLTNEIKKVEYDAVADWYGSEMIKGNNSIFYDDDKCIKCGRCIRMCSQVQGINVLSMIKRGNDSHIGIGCGDKPESYTNTVLDCISCAQCTYICPVGALTVKDCTKEVFGHIQSLATNHRKILIAQTAPAVRVGIAEEFGKEPASYSAEKMVAGLKKMGFKYVFDTDFTADLTIMEEGTELIERVKKGGPFPMFTSCCPAWINLIEKHYPEFIPNLSSCRSPQGMLSSLIRHYWAPKMKIDPKDIVLVSIMPCGAKKDEIQRPQLKGETDYVLSTRELGKLYRMGNIDLDTIDPINYDDPLGESTGAAVIFGATGGVMEAALRTAYEIITKKPLPKLEFEVVRGLEGTKKAVVDIDGLKLKAAVCHTTGEAIKLMEKIKKKEEEFHFIEVMACRGGCVGGGGEPKKNLEEDILQRRLNATYTLDERNTIRKSHENKSVLKLYAEFLEKPLSHKSHHLLHTTYQNRKKK